MASNGRTDAIVVGGGHNGLITAGYLARAGLKVTLFERRPIVGGSCVTEEIAPGFRVPRTSYVCSLLLPEITRDFRLKDHGFQVYMLDPGAFLPYPDGRYMLNWFDQERARREYAKFSARDAETFWTRMDELGRLTPFIEEIQRTTPPSFPPRGLRDGWAFWKLWRRLRKLERRDLKHLVELMTASAAEYLDRRFESTEIKASLAVSATIGSCVGVMTPGSAYVLLHHLIGNVDGVAGAWGYVRGGMGGLTQALARACEGLGVSIHTGSEVERILVRDGRAEGVVLKNGDEHRARVVASNADPKRTYLTLVEPRHLDGEFLDDIRRFKIQGSSIKVNCALSELPNWTCLPGQDPASPHQRALFEIAPSMVYLEEAFDDLKYGRPSRRPMIEGAVPSTVDDSLAPKGRHVMSMFVQYAPYHLKEGTWPEIRERVADNIIDTLAEYAPNIKKAIIARDVVSPWDLEQEYGLTEGNIFHGEITPDQIFFLRPAMGWADYRSPLRGLYLCGSGAHPGGGVMGGPGLNASREILKDLGR
ncbi:MAG TPA: NAD(P)/FAD-dependent oxidoreductase [Candidatus Polarisedimenticolia bacterium]|nr:NAD(P)/FAD-dependent oxidoreductase [Candidatus Polarisedimenticolia bacterium]